MLTEKIAREAKPNGATHIIWDNEIKGLGLRITAKGIKSFVLNYRIDGKERRMTLGRHPAFTLRSARTLARDNLTAVARGVDPLGEKEEARQAPTVQDGLDRFFNEYAPKRIADGLLKASTLNEYRLHVAKYVGPKLGSMKITDVKRSHVESMVSNVASVQRNRVLAFVSRLFNQFEVWEYRQQKDNPAYRIEKTRETPRDRVLSPEELSALATALDAAEAKTPVSVAAIRFAALTGLRIGEVLAIQWDHVDRDTSALTLPETKTGSREHSLPSAAMDVLSGLPRIVGCAFVFSTNGRVPTIYRTVRNHFQTIAADAGLDNVKLHDLRRTVMTTAAANGASTHVMRDLLGHRTTQMADRYVRRLNEPVREAREEVATKMAAMMAAA